MQKDRITGSDSEPMGREVYYLKVILGLVHPDMRIRLFNKDMEQIPKEKSGYRRDTF